MMESYIHNSLSYVVQFLESYGWYLLGATVASIYLVHKLKPRVDKWKQEWEDAEYHKDPDKHLARMQAIQRVRDQQQQKLLEESQKAQLEQKKREEQKKAERLLLLKNYGRTTNSGEQGVGEMSGNSSDSVDPGAGPSRASYDYPLSRPTSSSTYRPPRRSACSGGGCGR